MRSSQKLMLGAVLAFSLMAPAVAQTPATLSDTALRKQMIAEGIAAYPAPCPCPYSLTPAGVRCGAKSAYSRGAMFAPKCFVEDISKADLMQKRQISYAR